MRRNEEDFFGLNHNSSNGNQKKNKIDLLTLDVNKLNKDTTVNKGKYILDKTIFIIYYLLESFEKITDYLQMLDIHCDRVRNSNIMAPKGIGLFKFVEKVEPEQKIEAKPEQKVEAKPEQKVEAKPEQKVEAKPGIKQVPKPEPVMERKPEPFKMDKKVEIKIVEKSKEEVKGKGKEEEEKEKIKKEEEYKKMLINGNQNNIFGNIATVNKEIKPVQKEEKSLFASSTSIFGTKIDQKLPLTTQPTITQPTPPITQPTPPITQPTPPITQPIAPIQPKEPIKQIPQAKTFKEKLLGAANSYWNKRATRQQTSKNPNNKKITEKIILKINPQIDQLYTEEDIPPKVKVIQDLLKELYTNKMYELYDFAINYLCQGILTKSEKYIKEEKSKFQIYSKFIFLIKSPYNLLEDFYKMILVYKCPYVIPVQFTEKDFPDKETYMKRLGYADQDESVTSWNSNMECYAYLYFSFLAQDNKYLAIIKEYLSIMEKEAVNYPVSTVFKAFLNTLGAKVKAQVEDGMAILKKIVVRFVKELEALKAKTKNVNLKEITSENIYFIKKYYQNINTGVKTDMYS